MPVLDGESLRVEETFPLAALTKISSVGFGATRAIRRIEAERRRSSVKSDSSASTSSAIQQVVQKRTKIFALSGRATVDDKKQAFSAGVDG